MKKSLLTLAALAMAATSWAEVANTLFMIGEPAGSWDPAKGLELTKTEEGVFELDVTFTSEMGFGFVKELNNSGDWGALNGCRYTPAEADTQPVVGENDMVYNGGETDYCWKLGAGNWHFVVNTNTMKFALSENGGPVVPPVPTEDLYFVGEVTDWAFSDEYKLTADGAVYTFSTGTIRGGLQFKISASSWNPAYTSLNLEMETGNTYDVVTGDGLGNMQLAVDVTDAVLTLDTEKMTLKIEGTAGVNGVVADENAAPEYFTLDGVRVDNPGSGIFIERRGDRVVKRVIR